MYTSHGHHIMGTILGERPARVMRCGGPGLCGSCSAEAVAGLRRLEEGPETHTEDTLFKVRSALLKSGLTEIQALEAIVHLQNAGILFRERA